MGIIIIPYGHRVDVFTVASLQNLQQKTYNRLLYTIHYLGFESPKLHDVALRLKLSLCMVRLRVRAHPVRVYVICIYLLIHKCSSYVQYVYPHSQAQYIIY